VQNLFDITRGNYRVFRLISYPKFPNSHVILDVKVRAVSGSEWLTDIYVKGTYDGPTDIVANEDYQLLWTADSGRLLETGGVTLVLASGERVEQVWSSIITPENRPKDVAAVFKKFPRSGEIVTASVSPFKFSKNGMSYTWDGSVKKQPRQRKPS
jgi:hypothetical protein